MRAEGLEASLISALVAAEVEAEAEAEAEADALAELEAEAEEEVLEELLPQPTRARAEAQVKAARERMREDLYMRPILTQMIIVCISAFFYETDPLPALPQFGPGHTKGSLHSPRVQAPSLKVPFAGMG